MSKTQDASEALICGLDCFAGSGCPSNRKVRDRMGTRFLVRERKEKQILRSAQDDNSKKLTLRPALALAFQLAARQLYAVEAA